jgi:hypothetical protein
VERAFAQVTRGTAEDKSELEVHLKKLIADAVAINGLWVHDWEKEPLLRLRKDRVETASQAGAGRSNVGPPPDPEPTKGPIGTVNANFSKTDGGNGGNGAGVAGNGDDSSGDDSSGDDALDLCYDDAFALLYAGKITQEQFDSVVANEARCQGAGDDDLDFSIEFLGAALGYPLPKRGRQPYFHAFTPVWEFSVVPTSHREAIAKAALLKETGNAALKDNKERHAIIIYNAAKALIIERSPEGTALLAVLHANLAQAFLANAQSPNNSCVRSADDIDPNMLALSVAESTQALELDPSHEKARHRRALALALLGCYEKSMADLKLCAQTADVVERQRHLQSILEQVSQRLQVMRMVRLNSLVPYRVACW